MSDARNWQVSINDPRARVEGVEDVAQCVYIILTTIPGSDPLRPDFGCNLYRYIDRPTTEAQAMLIYEVVAAINRWEPRINVKKCLLSANGIDGRTVEVTAEMVKSATQITVTVTL